MNYTKLLPVVVLGFAAASCSDDKEPRQDVPDQSGKEVNFTISSDKGSRTWYGDESWGANVPDADIFWGNPFTGGDEEVVIYGKYAGRNEGHYTVSGYGTPSYPSPGQNVATTLTKKGSMGV